MSGSPAPPDLPGDPPVLADVAADHYGYGLEAVVARGAHFGGGVVSDLRLTDVLLERCDLAGAGARSARLRRVHLQGCRLTGALFGHGQLEDVRFTDCRMDVAGLGAARMSRVVLEDCVLTEADLQDAELRHVHLERCDLRGADLTGARLHAVSLRGCTLDDVRGAAALRGVTMHWADVTGAAVTLARALDIVLVDDEDDGAMPRPT